MKAALLRYQVMATIVGVLLVVLCLIGVRLFDRERILMRWK